MGKRASSAYKNPVHFVNKGMDLLFLNCLESRKPCEPPRLYRRVDDCDVEMITTTITITTTVGSNGISSTIISDNSNTTVFSATHGISGSLLELIQYSF